MKDSEPKNIALFSKSKQNMKSIDEPLPWMKIAIKIINLHKRNKLHNIIKGLHMNVYMGHITVLLSPNLINVITILQILTGMVQASYGKIIVQGTNVLQYSNKFKQLLGFSIDVNALFNSLSVKEHLMFFSILRGMTVKKAKHETFNLITFLNLQNQASCTPGMLSLGIRKRLCLAISLIGDPEFLILNQPTEHVDSESTKQLRDKIIVMVL
ncbi:phospholipid-transporting ATPase ABCA3-like [Adelges cooleyi]|uniref:phospholipid-transporting ATPase ABCA3-like n=1 Tax=Adelges cooleyi TaxID=133065 RepID=UPI00218029F7|nr:phospholipid-transporting ATPase ABCA3-like [Adelges cooleyi]